MILSPFEWTIAKRYMMPGRSEAVITLVASISIGVVMLSVAMLVIVMSVMNGFRAELIDRITGLNGHAVVQAYGGRLEQWEDVLTQVQNTPGVTRAVPMVEQPLLASFNGRADAVLVRGSQPQDIGRLNSSLLMGDLATLTDGQRNVAIGSRLALKMGLQLGDVVTIINPQGRATPFGTVPRQIGYTVTAIFEVGIYDFDERMVIMPMANAQTLLLMGDTITAIEVTTEDAERAREIMEPVAQSLNGRAVVTIWQEMNASLFEALQVERVAMAFALGIIVLVAAFNILSSLVMLVRSKTRDIAIMRTMGARRQSLLKIFVTTGSIVGMLGTFAGLALGLMVLAFRQPIVSVIEMMSGQELWNPEVRFLTELHGLRSLRPLRVLSSYSMLEGAIDPKAIAKLAKERGFPAIAICDRNGLYGAHAPSPGPAASAGVQPIIGALLGRARAAGGPIDYLPLFAQDDAGWHNLCHLVSRAHLDRPLERDPHVTLADLEGRTDGLIALTGAGEGGLTRLLADGKAERGGGLADRLEALFPGRLYIELARRGDPVEEAAEDALVDLAYAATCRWWPPTRPTSPIRTCTRRMTPCCASPIRPTSSAERPRSNPQAWVKSGR
jgi:lipoprotein-releasing system permease protein